jgi:hypothetical protein
MQNGVMSRLQALPKYPQSEVTKKQNNLYELYVRPTIFWSLKCELSNSNPVTREDALSVFENSGLPLKIPITLIVCSGIYAIWMLYSSIKNLADTAYLSSMESVFVVNMFRLGFLLLLGSLGWYLFNEGYALTEKELENILALQSLSQCSDADTQFTSDNLIASH